ncbi:MAG: bifunctional folylpolyglutamate synthase/dihydrofolate synthase [Ruminococcaceae bacterium]|nr:bifunctional folylpolyglutamate synthase/dihydrofolate synthase [Oscillospiraceae bacterium]
MEYSEALNYLNTYTKSGKPIKDLSRFKGLMNALDNVQDNLKYIHIAGTNGKGSVSEYTALALEYSGLKTGKFTSPYINRIEERIQINGEPISESDFAFYIEKTKKAAEKTNCGDYSQFEILNAAAFLYFYEKNCDYVVLETGIGGLLDCSNIITPELSVITTVDLDHCGILGDTVEKIARHKAGIIKPNHPAILAPFQYEEVKGIIEDKTAETGSELIIPKDKDLQLICADLSGTRFLYKNKEFVTGMCGRHQMINAAAAIEALRKLSIGEEYIKNALKNAAVPARMEKLRGFIIDGAHNVSGAKAAAELIGEQKGKKLLITGMLKSKDYKWALSILIPEFDKVIAVDFFSPDAVPAEEIVKLAEGSGRKGEIGKSARGAIEAAARFEGELKVVCGSLYLCGAIRGELIIEK